MKKLFFFLCALMYLSLTAQNTEEYTGSGIALSSNGYIATNNHVVEDGLSYEIDVFTNDIKKTYKAILVKADKENDLAVIKITDPTFKTFGTIPYTFKMLDIKVGEKVFTMGYPETQRQGEEVKVTDGIISSKTGYNNDNKVFQISASIQHGSSGGPLFDYAGNLIGITNAGFQDLDNVGYAIKITYLNNLIDLITDFPSLPSKTTIGASALTDKIKVLSKYIVLIHVKKPGCDLSTPNLLYKKIDVNYSYEDIAALFNNPGENTTNSTSSKNEIEHYKWAFCNSKSDVNSIVCTFKNKKLWAVSKFFPAVKCNPLVIEANYKLIAIGSSYDEVCKLLNDEGDRHSISFSSNRITSHYRWYNCDGLKIEVMFINGVVKIVQTHNSR